MLYLLLKNFSCCHWNFSNLIAHNVSKTSLLEAYNAVYRHDFLCISETNCGSSVLAGDGNMQLSDYNMMRTDHLSNAK